MRWDNSKLYKRNMVWSIARHPKSLQTKHVDVDMGNRLEDMIHNFGLESFQQVHAPLYDTLQNDLKNPLYPGCTKFARLSVVLDLVNLKAKYG